MSTLSTSAPDAPESFASLPASDRARAWVAAAEEATGDDRRSESYAEAAHAFAEAGDHARAVECLDALLALAEPKVRAAQRGVDAATLVGEHGRALRLYTWVLPTISLDDKRAATAVTLADEAAKLADRPLERFFLREAMAVQRSEELLARFAQSAVHSSREEGVLDDDDRRHAVLSLVHLARRHQGEPGFAYAASALELDPRNDDALELFVDRGVEAELQDAVRERLEAAVFVLGSERQAVALGRLAASLDDRPTGALPEAPASGAGIASIVDVEEVADAPVEPGDPRVEALLAEAASLQSFPSLHVTKLREVLVIDPLEARALGELRGILAARGDHEGLREVLVEAAEAAKTRRWPVAKRLPIVRELAELCADTLDDPIGAIEALEELVKSDARNDEARTALRGHLERVGRWDAVVRLVEEGLASAPVQADALAELAKIHLERRRDPHAAAAVLLRRAQLLRTDAIAWRELVQLVRTLRDSSKLEAALLEMLEAVGGALTTTERAGLAEELAGLRRTAGDLAGAEKLYTDAALGTRDARLFASAERCACDLGAFERAARAALAQADLADAHARADHLVRAAAHFAAAGSRKLTLATLRDAVAAGASPGAVAPVLERCAQEDAAEAFEWVATLALRTQRDRAGWLARAEALAAGQSQSPRAVALVRELLRLEPTTARLRLLAPLPWSTDDELRAIVGAIATSADADAPLRTEAALLTSRAHAAVGDREGALRGLRALPRPYDARVVAELLELGAGVLGAQEELELVEQALASSVATDGAERAAWLERAAALAAARGDTRRELRFALELLERDPEDFDRLERASRLARAVGDDAVLDRCLARAIEVEADDESLAALVRERADLLEGKLGRIDEAIALVAEHAVACAELRPVWVTLAERHARVASASETLARFESLDPAEAAVDAWLERLPSDDAWLALATAAAAKSRTPSRRSFELALGRGEQAHARALFAAVGPNPVPHLAIDDAKRLAQAGLGAEAFASVSAHVGLTRAERPPEVLGLALALAPTANAAIAALAKVDGLTREAFHDALGDVLARVVGPSEAVMSVLSAARAQVDVALIAARTADLRVVEALVVDEHERPIEAHRAMVAAVDRLAAPRELRIEARARAWSAYPDLAAAGLGALDEHDRIAALERASTRAPLAEPLAVALATALLEASRLDEAHDVAAALVERSPAHRELLESIFERRGQVNDLVASLEKRWSLEKDPARRVAIARRIAETLERSDGDPREVADAWRRVLRLEPKDPNATAALERAKSRALGAMRGAPAAPPPTTAAEAAPPALPDDAAPPASGTPDDPGGLADAPRAPALSTTAAYEVEDVPAEAGAPRASTTEAAEVDGLEPDDGAIRAATAEQPTLEADAAPLELTSEPEIPEALESSELLDDAALESIPDAEELA